MVSTLPRIAADSGAPAFCTACMTAEPTPARSLGRSTSAVDAAVASASPKPTPVIAVQVAMNAFPLATVIVAPSTRPQVSSVNPRAAVSLVVSRAATRSATPAPSARPAISGSSRTPLPIADTPRMAWKNWGVPNSRPNIAKMPNAWSHRSPGEPGGAGTAPGPPVGTRRGG